MALVLVAQGLPEVHAASISEAKDLMTAGRAAEAVAQLREIVAADPDDLAGRFWLGRALVAAGDLDGAAEQLQAVLDAKPDSTESRYWLAETRRRQGRVREARALLQEILADHPDHDQANASMRAVTAEIERQQQMLGESLADWVLPVPHRRVALEATGLNVSPGDVDIYSDHVYDYTFADPPADWTPAGGTWETTSRWTCSPQWSWFGGFEQDGLAAVWTKRQFVGDITVEVYAGFKMGVAEGTRSYGNPNDMNVTICGDGANPASGYSFIYGGDLNSSTRIMRGETTLAESREAEALLPIWEDGQPQTYDFHRKWWMLRVRKKGDLLQFWVGDRLVAEATDPQPLEGGRVAVWSRDNGLILSRIKIYYEREQIPRDPAPLQHLAVRTVDRVHPRHATLTSSTHPGVYTDFETDLGPVGNRDGDQGAMVTIAAPGAGGSAHCAKLVNRYAGGSFAASLHIGKFDLRMMPRLAFDYRLEPDAKVNIYLTVNDRLCEVAFSGLPYPAGGATMIGAVPDVQADDQWHHVDFDLLGHVEQALGTRDRLVAHDLFIGNLNSEGYLDAGFGGNRAGTHLLIDNLALYRPSQGEIQVAASPGEDVEPTGWAIAMDRDPHGLPPAEITSENGDASFEPAEEGWWYIHARPRLPDGAWGETETLAVVRDTQPPAVVAVEPDDEALIAGGPIRIRVSDGAGVGVDPGSIRLAVADERLDVSDDAVSFDPASETIELDVVALGRSFPQSGSLSVELLGMADRNGAKLVEPVQWTFLAGPDTDRSAPSLPMIAVGEVPVLGDDFETDLGEWDNWGARAGAELSRDASTAASGRYSLKLYNPMNGGSFGAYARKTRFDAGRYRLVRFAYKIPERLRADILVHVNGSRKSIHFTDTDSSYTRIGEVPDVIADNQWHHAAFDLYEMLRREDPHAPGYEVQQMWIADTGWTSNASGQVYHLDDFELVPIVSAAEPLQLSWQVLDLSGLAGVNWAVDASPDTELPQQILTTADSVAYQEPGDVDGWLHVRASDSAGNWSATAHQRLLVDSQPPIAAQQAPPADVSAAVSEVSLELADEGIAGIDPGSIILSVGDNDYSVENAGLTYLSDRGRLVWNSEETSPKPTIFDDGAVIDVKLKSAADYAGNPVTGLPSWSWTMDYSKDTVGPQIARIDCSTHRTHVAHTFESDTDGWSNRGGSQGASVERDASMAASGEASVKLTQQQDGGHMQALVTSKGFPADKFPVISFDYRFDPGVKLDLLVHMAGQWWAIAMTDNPSGTIGRVPGMRADGKWHHASVNLAPILKQRQRRGPLNVDAVIVGDRNSRDNRKGATAHFDNFIIGSVGTVKPVFRWGATDTTGVAGYSYVLDQQPATVPPAQSQGTAAAKSFEGLQTGVHFLHVRAVDGAGNWGPPAHYAIVHVSG
ncbi:MAG: tetratricopeptide repeat protein [Armatimonadota bacterium]|nr:tetratricopeptide repeat protein [Armatimonadota bacterium]